MHPRLDIDDLGLLGDTRRPCLVDVAEEVLALDELHREEDHIALVGYELVQVNEVRVKDVRERPKLLLESIEIVCVEVHQGLERDALLQLAVEYFVDDAHAALTEAAQHLVPGSSLPDGAFRSMNPL